MKPGKEPPALIAFLTLEQTLPELTRSVRETGLASWEFAGAGLMREIEGRPSGASAEVVDSGFVLRPYCRHCPRLRRIIKMWGVHGGEQANADS